MISIIPNMYCHCGGVSVFASLHFDVQAIGGGVSFVCKHFPAQLRFFGAPDKFAIYKGETNTGHSKPGTYFSTRYLLCLL